MSENERAYNSFEEWSLAQMGAEVPNHDSDEFSEEDDAEVSADSTLAQTLSALSAKSR